MFTFLSSIGKQNCKRFRIAGEFISYGGGSISISLDALILYLLCYHSVHPPFLLGGIGGGRGGRGVELPTNFQIGGHDLNFEVYVSEKHILNGLVPS